MIKKNKINGCTLREGVTQADDQTIKSRLGFTLAEVLITLSIIGVVAAMTIPTLINNSQERQMVTGLLKFNSTLQQAVQMWKQEVCGGESAYNCFSAQGLSDNVVTNFDQIKKYLKVVKETSTTTDRSWLPDDTLNYYGDSETCSYGKVTKTRSGNGAFLLSDGTTFSIDSDDIGFIITVDVNGAKPPNRMGKDTFDFLLGKKRTKDIAYGACDTSISNAIGQCNECSATCNPDNVDPTKDNGASLTSYVLTHHKLPDFKTISQTVEGFKP